MGGSTASSQRTSPLSCCRRSGLSGGCAASCSFLFRRAAPDCSPEWCATRCLSPQQPSGWWLIGTSDRYIVLAFCGVDANGMYSVAYRIPSIISTVASIFIQAWQVSAVKEFDPKDSDGFLRRTYFSVEALVVVLCSVLIPLVTSHCLGDVLGRLLWGVGLRAFAARLRVTDATEACGRRFFLHPMTHVHGLFDFFCRGCCERSFGASLVTVFGVAGSVLSSVLAGLANWGFRSIRARRISRLISARDDHWPSTPFLTIQAL